MKFIKLTVFLLLYTLSLSASGGDKSIESFPDKPIKIIVYTGPGGLIDVTARKFSDIASRYVDVNFVVENKPGAGGIVALKRVLQMPNDGYTLYACTKSNISKFVVAGGDDYVDALDWLALLMSDPECIITNRKMALNTWEDILNNANENPEKQNWLGPATGGLDHITALKIWEKSGLDEQWIPYKSGGKARAALLGGQGIAYIGNPREILGNEDLQIAAVSGKKRLEQFPDAPTFNDLGIEGLDNETMWRGFAIKKGVDPEILEWYKKLFIQVSTDPDWKSFWERGGIDITYIGPDEFGAIVKENAIEFTYYLKRINIIETARSGRLAKLSSPQIFPYLLISIVFIIGFISFRFYRSDKKYLSGHLLIIMIFIAISILFYILSFSFPSNSQVGPEVVPRLWIFILLPLSLLALVQIFKEKRENLEVKSGRLDMVSYFIVFLIGYLFVIYFIGYYISTFIFLLIGMRVLGNKNLKIQLIIAVFWNLFSYLVFYKVLYIPLPLGRIIETIL
ncbi:MAG: tripartite tricarboxylate transporter TctB family protein [Candidatus Marinimicrobia bacterium]|nr:tripartite tricarboxylate transporter TctB family protein [Candidatus Neomarinimicrobiota bacterium]